MGPGLPESPRLLRLSRLPNGARRRAVSRLWKELDRTGTPLVEPVKGGGRDRWVTFLWQGTRSTKRVEVTCNWSLTYFEPLERLPGTDLWFRTYRYRDDFRGVYVFVVDRPASARMDYTTWVTALRTSQCDPRNPRRLGGVPNARDPDGPGGIPTSEVVLSGSSDRPEFGPVPAHARGNLREFEVRSRALGGERTVWAYTPAGWRKGTPGGNLAIFFDGHEYAHFFEVPRALDGLHYRRAIAPTVALFVVHPAKNGRANDLRWNPKFGQFLAEELLPWARKELGVHVPAARTLLAGASLGGVAAAYWAFHRPDRFGLVLSQSGAFGDTQDPEQPEQFAREVADLPQRNTRYFLEAGLLETSTAPGVMPSLLVSNRHLRDILRLKGYPVEYREFYGGHDDACWRQGVVVGLRALLGRSGGRTARRRRAPPG